MKKNVLTLFKKIQLLLHRKWGYYIEVKRLPSAKDIYIDVFRKDIPILQFYQLKEIAHLLAVNNKNRLYDEVLKSFITNWDIEAETREFMSIGEGNGGINLNVYRKVLINGNFYFEKVYFSEAPELERLLWFSDKITPQIETTILVPKIYKAFHGELITIVYFEFLDLNSKSTTNENLIDITQKLYTTSLKEKVRIEIENAPKEFLDYRLFFYYKKYRKQHYNKLLEIGVNPQIIENSLSKSRKIITHSDIYKNNYFLPNTLIDWDDFGLYPLGFDVARVYDRIITEEGFKVSPLEWLKSYYMNTIEPSDWEMFELGFTYFLYVFSYEKLESEEFNLVKDEMLDYLKRYSEEAKSI